MLDVTDDEHGVGRDLFGVFWDGQVSGVNGEAPHGGGDGFSCGDGGFYLPIPDAAFQVGEEEEVVLGFVCIAFFESFQGLGVGDGVSNGDMVVFGAFGPSGVEVVGLDELGLGWVDTNRKV